MMKQLFDMNAFLDQTIVGLDTQAMLGDVEDFIAFSENNIDWQKRRELRRAECECDKEQFDDILLASQYRDQTLDNVEYRFEVSLKQRVRYAGLIALITTIEWVLLALKERAAFTFPKKPDNKNQAVHILDIFNKKASLGLEVKAEFLESIVRVRNCLVHAAGLLASYSHEEQLRQSIAVMSGIKVSNVNFLGDGIEIEDGFLESVIEDVKQWLPIIEKSVSEQGFLRK